MNGKIVPVNDGLASMLGGLGDIDRDKSAGSFYTYPFLPLDQVLNLYRGSWLARKIIDVPTNDAFRKGIDWQADNADITKIEETMSALGLMHKLMAALQRGDLFGGGAVFIGTGETNLDRPLEIERIGKGGVKYLTVMSRWDLSPGPLNLDVTSEFFGEPTYYQVNGNGVQQRIHPSRLVIFKGAELPDQRWTFAAEGIGWGDSILLAKLAAIKGFDSTYGNIVSLVFEANIDVFGVPQLIDQLNQPPTSAPVSMENRMLKRFWLAAASKGINRSIIKDAAETFERKAITFGGLAEILDRMMTTASGAADIPSTRLFGMSPAGMSATGESDMRNYYDNVGSRQKNVITPAAHKLFEAVIRSTFGTRPADLFYLWAPLWQSTAKELAEIGKINADTANVWMTSGLIPPEALSQVVITQQTEAGIYPGLEEAAAEAPPIDFTTDPNEPLPDDPNTDPQQTNDYDPSQPRNKDGESTGGGLTAGETNAISYYKNKNFAKVNTGLRSGADLDSATKEVVSGLDSAIDKQAGSTKAATLYRGIKSQKLADQARKNPASLVGKTVTDNGFMSTSTETGAAKHFAGNSFGASKSAVIMQIKAPKGTKALSMDGYTKSKNVFTENEMLLKRGSSIKITKVSEWSGAVLIEGELQ